jgi:ZIP family zinc transporter
MLELLIAASATALATGLGAIPVFLLGERAAALRPALLGLASGVMVVASVLGLIAPALDRGSLAQVGGGILLGLGFLFAARRVLQGRRATLAGAPRSRMPALVFLVLFVHSLPEGFAVGTAYATDPEQLGLFVVLAISLQNIPEGTSVAIPLAAQGASAARQFWAAVASSAPQPVGAVIAYVLVEEITALLPISFGFAAGAMLTLVAIELLPQAVRGGRRDALLGVAVGAAVMTALSLALQV